MDDGWIYFSNLAHILGEDMFAIVDQEKDLFKLNTTQLECVVRPLEAKLTLVVKPLIVDGIITREVYVAINSKGTKSLEEWERCLSALFSFIFSTHISGSKIWPFEVGKYTKNLSVVSISSKEMKRIRGEYKSVFRQMILELSVIVCKWATKWFDHAARPLGIYKYLETVQPAERTLAEFQISLISEAFVHYFGDKNIDSAEKCIKRQYGRLSEHAGVQLIDKSTFNEIWKFYGNFKHFTKGNQETTPVVNYAGEERVTLLFLAQSLFQFSVLYELLEDTDDTFKSVYMGLVKHHEVLNKIYVI